MFQQRKSSIIRGSSSKHLKQHHTKLQVNSSLQHTVVSVLPHIVDQMLWIFQALGSTVYYLRGASSVCWLVVAVNCVAICTAWRRPETSEMDVFTLQLITMSDAASLDVWGGEMPAKCSHHDLTRWFSCSSAPSAVLCNSETPTQQFPWPACVTSAFVHIRHVAHNPVKHVERLLQETRVQWAVNQCGVCGLKMGRMGESENGYREKGITVWGGKASNFPYESKMSVKSVAHTHTVYLSYIQKALQQAFLLLSVLVAQQCCSWQRLAL